MKAVVHGQFIFFFCVEVLPGDQDIAVRVDRDFFDGFACGPAQENAGFSAHTGIKVKFLTGARVAAVFASCPDGLPFSPEGHVGRKSFYKI